MSHPVLVVDADFANLRLLTRLLDQPDIALSFASSTAPALSLLESRLPEYHLILLERDLPGSDGLRFLQGLKQDSRFAHIPVIMQTAIASPEQISEGLTAGAAYYVAKPIQPDLLMALVRSALSESTGRRSLEPRERQPSRLLQALQQGDFHFRTLHEARELAAELSGLCPEPERVALGLTELMINAIEHGNLEITYDQKSELCRANAWQSEVECRLGMPAYCNRMAHVHVSRRARSVDFLVRDEGPGFRWRDFLKPDPSRVFAPNGRGIALARELAFSGLDYRDPGNVVLAQVATDEAT
ncbi:MAG: response regulator [Polyangiaceae bacterium]